MAIKINGKDLVKRIINWQEVSKVILNGSQIRPTYQQYVNYHVVSNFAWWGWWGWGWWATPSWRTNNGWVFGEYGVSNWGSGQVVNQKYNGLPSLKNAVKVEIIYQIYWDLSEITTPFDATLLRNQNREYYTKLVSGWDQIFWCSSDLSASLSGATAWAYNIRTVLDLEHNEATQVIEWPNGFRSDVGTYTLNGTEIANIRNCNEYVIYLNNWVSLSQVDFYVYNGHVSSWVGPGIYHHTVMGLLSYSSDGENRITIADKDIGQEVTWDWCPNCYQRWNNYAFEYPWSWVTTSSTRVDASAYWPSTYDSSTFITSEEALDWDTSGNADLWGWVTGTKIAQQGPCPIWFHVATESEFTSLFNIINSLVWDSTMDTIKQYLLIDFWIRMDYYDATPYYATTSLWTWISSSIGKVVSLNSRTQTVTTPSTASGYGLPVRPFKNEPVVPDATWTVLFQPS